MNIRQPPQPAGLGWLIALVVLVFAIALLFAHGFTWAMALIAALAAARLT